MRSNQSRRIGRGGAGRTTDKPTVIQNGTSQVPTPSIETYLTYQLARAHRRLHAELDERLQAENISVEQWRVLEILADRAGRSMGSLAELVLMNHPALTKLADRMVASGLIHRVADPDDQRRVLVHATDRGLAIHARLRPIVDTHGRRIEETFGASKAAALRALLEDLADGHEALARG
ncbi:MarR family transcriptional regulator [Nitratireductor sp. CAU 1489]|uniref:MarR family transcriptional regulator n=1 Tax=Nitratireductor arenosus TaxID=2682096 RepID=A0A844QPC9_9HYPH|nr:MarR family transcriptional regulator [Nitratireductor arenosus]MVA99810.1 MarR family transcriptional regulator [Nitratireductor arenosus]